MLLTVKEKLGAKTSVCATIIGCVVTATQMQGNGTMSSTVMPTLEPQHILRGRVCTTGVAEQVTLGTDTGVVGVLRFVSAGIVLLIFWLIWGNVLPVKHSIGLTLMVIMNLVIVDGLHQPNSKLTHAKGKNK